MISICSYVDRSHLSIVANQHKHIFMWWDSHSSTVGHRYCVPRGLLWSVKCHGDRCQDLLWSHQHPLYHWAICIIRHGCNFRGSQL